MDLSHPVQRAVFFEAHDGLPREAPGSLDSTRRALALALRAAGSLGIRAVLDLGCGPGQQTMDLAAMLPDAGIIAVDLHEPFLRELRRRAAAAGVHSRVTPVRADLGALPVRPRCTDLLWCEGAAYIPGIPAFRHSWLCPGPCCGTRACSRSPRRYGCGTTGRRQRGRSGISSTRR